MKNKKMEEMNTILKNSSINGKKNYENLQFYSVVIVVPLHTFIEITVNKKTYFASHYTLFSLNRHFFTF